MLSRSSREARSPASPCDDGWVADETRSRFRRGLDSTPKCNRWVDLSVILAEGGNPSYCPRRHAGIMRRTSLGEDLDSRGGHENDGGEREADDGGGKRVAKGVSPQRHHDGGRTTGTAQRKTAWIPVAATRMTAKETHRPIPRALRYPSSMKLHLRVESRRLFSDREAAVSAKIPNGVQVAHSRVSAFFRPLREHF